MWTSGNSIGVSNSYVSEFRHDLLRIRCQSAVSVVCLRPSEGLRFRVRHGTLQSVSGFLPVLIWLLLIRDAPCAEQLKAPHEGTQSDALMRLPDDLRRQLEPVEVSQRWCGARALWILLRSNGRDVNFSEVLAAANPSDVQSEDGILSLLQLESASRQFRMECVSYRANSVNDIVCPAITVHCFKDSPYSSLLHSLVVLRVTEGKVTFIDPFVPGRQATMSEEVFQRSWKSVAMSTVQDVPEFETPLVVWLSSPWLSVTLLATFLIVRRISWTWDNTKSLVAILAVLLVTGCTNSSETTSRNNEMHKKRPLVHFEANEITEASAISGQSIRHAFNFRNVSTKEIYISSVKTNCSCTAADYETSPILPSKGGTILLSVDGRGRRGVFATSAVVTFETRNPEKGAGVHQVETLVAGAEFIPNVQLLPQYVAFSPTPIQSRSEASLVLVECASEETELTVVQAAISNPLFSVKRTTSHTTDLDGLFRRSTTFVLEFAPVNAGKLEDGTLNLVCGTIKKSHSVVLSGRGEHSSLIAVPATLVFSSRELYQNTVVIKSRNNERLRVASASISPRSIGEVSIVHSDSEECTYLVSLQLNGSFRDQILKAELHVAVDFPTKSELILPVTIIDLSSHGEDR